MFTALYRAINATQLTVRAPVSPCSIFNIGMLRAVLLLIVVLFSYKSMRAQTHLLDSLRSALDNAKNKYAKVDLLNELSYQYFDVNDTAAMYYASDALKLATELNYPNGEQYAYTLLGLGLSSSGKRIEATKYFKKASAITGASSRNTTTYNWILWGILCTELAQYDSADLLFRNARSNALITDYADLQSIYKNLGHLYALQWKNQQALRYLDSAQKLVSKGDTYMEMEVLSQLGFVYLNLAQIDKAEKIYGKFCTLAVAGSDYYHKVECSLFNSRLMLMKGESTKSLQYGLDALKNSSQYNFSQYVEVLTQIGEVYMELSQFELSGQYLYEALKVSEQAGLRMRTANLYTDLAWLMKIEGQYLQALVYSDKAEAIYKDTKDKRGLADVYNVRGLILVLLNDHYRASIQYNKALTLRKEINDLKGVSATLYNQAELLHQQKKSDQALILLKEVVGIEKGLGNLPYLAMTYGVMARVLTDQGKFGDAANYLLMADKTGNSEQSLIIKRDNASHYTYYYEAKRDYRNALKYSKLSQDLSNKIYSKEGLDKFAEYEALYKAETRTKEIELLQQHKKNQEQELHIQAAQLSRKNIVILAIIIIAIFLGAASIRINQLNTSKALDNKKLLALNSEITQQRDDSKKNLQEINLLKNSLEIREKQYRGLVEGVNDIIHELDEKGNFSFVNSAVEQITGYTPEELLGSHYSLVVHPDYRQYIVKLFSDQVSVNESGSYLEFPIISKHGNTVWLGQNTSFFYQERKLRRVSVVARDITKQKEVEQELLKSQHEYQSLVDSIPIGIYKTITYPNNEFAFLYVSSRWCLMNGLTMGAVLKNASLATELIHPDDKFSFMEAERQARGNNYRFVWEGRVVIDGGTKYMRIESHGQRLTNGNIIRNGIQKDITERKLTEKEMIRARLAAERAYAVKSDFIANITHEMQTPLNGIIGFTDLLLHSTLTQTQEQYVQQVANSSTQLLGQINNLLDFAKMESGKIIINRLPANLRIIMLMVVKQFEAEAQSKKLLLIQRVSDTIPQEITVDEERIRQILTSLVSNALKFTHTGSIEIQLDRLSDYRIRFSVLDTGIGISPADLIRIFEPFEQGDNSTTKRYQGSGLGLSIAARSAKLLGSEIKVESIYGKGSIFYFDLKI